MKKLMSINNLPTTSMRHDMKMIGTLESVVYTITIKTDWEMRRESRPDN